MKRLEIVPVGSPNFPRFIIQDSGGRVFDGEKMVADRKKAVVFVEGQSVALAYNALQESPFKNMPLTEFTVALNIRVRAGETFTKRQLAESTWRAPAASCWITIRGLAPWKIAWSSWMSPGPDWSRRPATRKRKKCKRPSLLLATETS